MIVCHQYRYIFLKTNKTAGTSVEIALSKHCGPDDIITRLTDQDEKLRNEWGGRRPQHHYAPLRNYRLGDVAKAIRQRRLKATFYHHMTATEVKQLVDPTVWRDYYKFTIERNPWDRVVSLYYHIYGDSQRRSFSDFVRSHRVDILKERGRDLYSIDGEVVVDRICLMENLQDDLEEVRLHLGIPEPLVLPKAKAGSRKGRDDYRSHYDDATRQVVAGAFAQEIEQFGYEF